MPPKKERKETTLELVSNHDMDGKVGLVDFADTLQELAGGLLAADDIMSTVMQQVNEDIFKIETLKKMNDYHANFCVERTCMISEMKMAMKDEKEDDYGSKGSIKDQTMTILI